MSVTSRNSYRAAYRSILLNSWAIGQTVRSRRGFGRTHRHRTSPRIVPVLRTVRTVFSIDRKKVKEIGFRIGRYDGRYAGGTAGRRP